MLKAFAISGNTMKKVFVPLINNPINYIVIMLLLTMLWSIPVKDNNVAEINLCRAIRQQP